MAAIKSPLRDRLLSPDPIKSSIIRDSGLGWISSPSNNGATSSQDSDSGSGSITSPLRISKRTASSSPRPLPQQPGQRLTRRSSSSYKHMTSNNLVSKSPFKTSGLQPAVPKSRSPAIPFPVTRRVSGEKRPRSESIHNQAEDENDRPFALKRERRQSKSYQGLVNKTPVSKSPFRSKVASDLTEAIQPPVPLIPLSNIGTNQPDIPHNTPSPQSQSHAAPLKPPTPSNGTGPSPGRSNLVSKRMRGPRVSNGYKRERRKTVTWDERMEVVEFDRDEVEDDEAVFDDEDPEVTSQFNPQDDDPFFHAHQEANDLHDDLQQGHATEYMDQDAQDADLSVEYEGWSTKEGTVMDSNQSISDLVNNLFASSDQPTATKDIHYSNHVDTPETHLSAQNGNDLSFTEPVEGNRNDDEGVLARFRRHSRSPSLHHIADFSPQLIAQSSPAGNRVGAGSPGLSQAPSRPSSRQSTESLGPTLSTGTPTRALPQTPPSRTTRAPTPSSERIIDPARRDEDRIASVDDVSQLPASPSPVRNNRRISGLDGEDGFLSLEASYHSIQEMTNESAFNSRNDESLAEEDASQLQKHDDQQINSIFIPDIADTSLGKTHPSNSRRSSINSMPDMKQNFQFPRRSQSPYFTSSRNSDHPSPASQRSSMGEISREEFSSRGTSPTPSVNSSRVSLDHDLQRSHNQEEDFQMEIHHDEYMQDHPSQHPDRSVEKTSHIVELDEPVMASKLDFDLGSNFETSVDEWSINCSDTSGMAPAGIQQDMTTHASMKMGDVDVDMDMRSALDRLMDDVAGAQGTPYIQRRRTSSLPSPAPSQMERPMTDSLLRGEFRTSQVTTKPPAALVPPRMDNIKAREQMILEKRREARRQEEEDLYGHDSRPIRKKDDDGRGALGVARPSRRRSLSTGDVGTVTQNDGISLDMAGGGLRDSIEKELQKLKERPQQGENKKYLVREREGTIYASSNQTINTTEEYDLANKAWKAIRRPSDMNEYAKQIREYRAQEKSGKAYGKVFVKVVGVKALDVPLPHEPTALTCTLNNGIHFVSTPECQLGRETRIDQEFELIEHSKLEFTLTLKIRRDSHIAQQFKEVLPVAPPRPVAPPPPVVQQSSSRGMRSFFSSSPKKSSKDKDVHQPAPPPPPTQPQRVTNNLARYLKPDGTLARAFVSFKEIAGRCDTRLFETSYPLIGQRVDLGGKLATLQVGEIVLQIFRLPPLPGLPPEQLPQSLDESLRGLRHINWHKVTYFEGTLTQLGGDCNTWRRRRFRVIGSNLVAFNDVTKRATATINLKKAIGIEDNQDREKALKSEGRNYDEDDALYGVERSFRLLFPSEQIITFFADSDEEKARWLDVFHALIGHIPPHPLWGELLWQRQEAVKGLTSQAPQSTSYNLTSQPAKPEPSWLVPKGSQR